MKRREMLRTSLAVGVTGLATAEGDAATAQTSREATHIYELRTYELRNDLQPTRLGEYFQQHLMPAARRAGIGPIGAFQVVSGQRTPALVVAIDHRSMAEMEAAGARLAADSEFTRATSAFEAELPYVRYESSLLRAFESHPKFEIPASDAGRPPRLFELRTYESRTTSTLRNKIEMFNQEEIKIFRDCGFATIFFGETIVGSRMPNLTYLIAFNDMAAREKAWDTFRANPDWERVKGRPGWRDFEAVTNISASYLRPTTFSQIR